MDPQLRAQAEAQAQLCGVFDHALRVLIVWALRKGEVSVGEIARKVDASVHNTSQHLRIMRDRRILTSRREGQTVYYRIAESSFAHDCFLLCQSALITNPVRQGNTPSSAQVLTKPEIGEET